MHYTAYSFAINSNIPTITAKDGSQLGNYIGLTSVDILSKFIFIERLFLTDFLYLLERYFQTESTL